jgi:hypothetical protein
MKAQDDQLWTQQVSDLRHDGEPGERFLAFFEFWFDAAETILGSELLGAAPIATAVRKALDVAEKELGFLTVDLIGQMLTVAVMHWHLGHELASQLTSIEARVMEEALARKIADLQESAKIPE